MHSSKTTASERLHGLDHLRTLAITLVFFFHYGIVTKGNPSWLPDLAQFGWTGVDFFFVLSGFLISSQLFQEVQATNTICYSSFFLKRFLRIVPIYIFILSLYFLVPIFREKEALPPLWKFLSFTQNINLNIKDYGTFSHAWSLCVEEHFYLLFPMLLLFATWGKIFKYLKYALPFLFLILIGIRYYSYCYLYLPHSTEEWSWMYWYKHIYYPSYTRFDGLLIGIALGALNTFLPKQVTRMHPKANLLTALGLFILIVYFYFFTDQQSLFASVFGFSIVSISYGCIVLAVTSSNSFLYSHPSYISTFIAKISYAIYLSHKGVIHITNTLLSNTNSNVVLAISIINCIIVGYLLYQFIEKPFMRLREKLRL